MKLIDALRNIKYDTSWGIWAEVIDGKFKADSPSRYGQREFEKALIEQLNYIF